MTRIWLKPWMAGLGLGLAAALVVLNFAAASFGAEKPWLAALNLAANLAALGTMIYVIVRTALAAKARDADTRVMLGESQARLAAVVDSAMDAIITVDEKQRIVIFNQAAEAIFGCRREDALGAPLDRFIPARFHDTHRGHVEEFGQTGVTNRRMGDTTTLWALRADGTEFPIEAAISQASESGSRFFTVILRDITQRKEIEDELKRKQAELRALSAQVLEAREEEKTRIARELHDELGQLLTALKMDLASLSERLPGPDAELAARVGQMNALLDRTVASVRRIAADLRPLMLDDLGLKDAVAWLVEDFSARSSVECSLDISGRETLDGVERTVATTVYRVLQESLTNIARHARAKNAWVVLDAGDKILQLEVEDDGRGIAETDLDRPRSLGLRGMRERVSYLGGSVEIIRAPRGGTRVLIRVPRAPAQGQAQ